MAEDFFIENSMWMFPRIVGVPPKSSIFNRVFQYKPSILGAYPYFWKHPYLSIGMQRLLFLCLCGLVGSMVGRAFDFKFGSVRIPSLLENIGFHGFFCWRDPKHNLYFPRGFSSPKKLYLKRHNSIMSHYCPMYKYIYVDVQVYDWHKHIYIIYIPTSRRFKQGSY